MRRYLGEHFIDGEWRPSHGSEKHILINPATEAEHGFVTVGDGTDVDAAVSAAQAALAGRAWRAYTLEQRCAAVRSMQQWLDAHAAELAAEIAAGLGQPIADAQTLGSASRLIGMYLDSVRQLDLRYLRRDRTGAALVTRVPVGVAAGITPWNTPVRGEVKKVVPAILSGCCIVLKPAPEAPIGAIAVAEAALAAGLPPGVVNVVFGGSSTGEELLRHEGVAKVGFTGSSATGARIAAACALNLKRAQLELGGKSPAVVLDDADVAQAAALISASSFANAGQTCTALTRVLVPRQLERQVTDALVDAARSYRLGDPSDRATTMGPLVSRRQRDRVAGYIEIGQAEGGRLLTGGHRPRDLDRGWFIEPAVFGRMTGSMRVTREEIFGPVLSVIAYHDIAEAITLANDSRFGLAAAVFGADEDRALAVGQRIQSGVVSVNRAGRIDSGPFGGMKESGIGREQGPEGYDAYLEYQALTVTDSLAAQLASSGIPLDRRH